MVKKKFSLIWTEIAQMITPPQPISTAPVKYKVAHLGGKPTNLATLLIETVKVCLYEVYVKATSTTYCTGVFGFNHLYTDITYWLV